MRGGVVRRRDPEPSGLTIVVFDRSASLSSALVERASRKRINEELHVHGLLACA